MLFRSAALTGTSDLTITAADLTYILKQIQIAEAHASREVVSGGLPVAGQKAHWESPHRLPPRTPSVGDTRGARVQRRPEAAGAGRIEDEQSSSSIQYYHIESHGVKLHVTLTDSNVLYMTG